MNDKAIYENVLVKYELSEAEKVEGSKLLAALIIKQKDLEDDKSAAAADYGQQIKESKKEICSLAQKIKDGYEMVDVRAEKTMNYESGEVVYLDENKDEVKVRPMTADEKQMQLPVTDSVPDK